MATQLANMMKKQIFVQGQKYDDSIVTLLATMKKEYNNVPKMSYSQLQDIKNIYTDMVKPMVRRMTLIEGTIKVFFTEHQEADKGSAVRIDAIKMQTDDTKDACRRF
jgi:hypothetical protein